MSMNANMHQISVREKTLLKTYLEVDMNEYLQSQMDSELFEGVTEQQKSQLIGNFFHFIKCRFSDCGKLAQTKSSQPTIAESKATEDAKNLKDWSSGKGNHVPAHSGKDTAYVQLDAKNPTGAESKAKEDEKNMKDWSSGKGNHVPAFSEKDAAYVQTNADETKKEKVVTNTAKEVQADLKKQEAQELVKPTATNENKNDSEPAK